MFICEVTGRQSQLGDKCHKIVTKQRERIYTKMVRNEETGIWEKVVAGKGWEIVQEISAMQSGLELWNRLSAEDREALLKVPTRMRIHLNWDKS